MALIDNLVAYYKLDETSGSRADSHGAFTLADTGSVSNTTGLISNAASFVLGSSQTLSIANDLGITGGAISISLWVKLRNEIASGIWGFAMQGDAGVDVHYFMGYDYNAGTRRVYVNRQRQNTSNNLIQTNTTLGTSTWHHIVLTYNATTLEGYLDGTSFGTLGTSGNGAGSGVDIFQVGQESSGYSGGTGGYCDANIDEVGVWSRAITSAEVTELYNSGSGKAYPFTSGTIKSYNGTLTASVKSILNGTLKASVKTWNGIT